LAFSDLFQKRGKERDVLTTGSIDYKLNEGLQLRGMPVEEFAAIAAKERIRFASKSRLFESFRNGKSLPNETAEPLWKLWQEIEALCQRAGRFRLDLSDGLQVYEWLKASREGSVYFIAVDLRDGR
jgi:hypothetical protein